MKNTNYVKTLTLLSLTFVFLYAVSAYASTFTYKGSINDHKGDPLNETVKILFEVYDSHDEIVWFRERFVTIYQGFFSVELGKTQPLLSEYFDGFHYISINVLNKDKCIVVPDKQVLIYNVVSNKQDIITKTDAKRKIDGQSVEQNISATKNTDNVINYSNKKKLSLNSLSSLGDLTLDGKLTVTGIIKTKSEVHVGNSKAPCNSNVEGSIRYNYDQKIMEYCNSKNWTSFSQTPPPPPDYFPSCKAILDAGYSTGDGVYTIQPKDSRPYKIYCDMTTDGGGWSMCYSEKDDMVHISSQTSFQGTYGLPGYRSDCRLIPYKEVLYVNHENSDKAWFSSDNGENQIIAKCGYNGGCIGKSLWTAHGVAVGNIKYQLLICDLNGLETGIFISGFTNCWKKCNNWCNDRSTPYFRTDGDKGSTYNGVAFNENGHRNVSYKTMSVGIR